MLRPMILAAFLVAPLAPALAQSAEETTVAVKPVPIETAAPATSTPAAQTPAVIETKTHAEGKGGCNWMRTAKLPVS